MTSALEGPPSTLLQTNDLPAQILNRIRAAHRVQVIGHARPDGDCIGSLLAVHYILEGLGVQHALAAEEHTYPGYRIIPGYDLIETSPRGGFAPDLAVFVDCADRSRAFTNWASPAEIVNIDHHGSNTRFGAINWVDPRSAATAEMLFHLARRAGTPLGADLANALLLGIMTDTGCLRFPNTRAEHFDICAELLRAGASVVLISKAAYEGRSAQSVKLGSAILVGMEFRCGGALGWCEARVSVVNRLGGPEAMPENLVNEIRSVEGVHVAILFTELPAKGLRASFRGDGTVDVSRLAGFFGGGGHPNAAGATLEDGSYETLRDQVLARAEVEMGSR